MLSIKDRTDGTRVRLHELLEAGHDVRTAADGASALQVATTFVPDIALLDIGLPVMDGYELAGLLKRTPSLARTTLVAFTGYAGDGDRRRALASGFSEHFAKPLHIARLLAFIDSLEP